VVRVFETNLEVASQPDVSDVAPTPPLKRPAAALSAPARRLRQKTSEQQKDGVVAPTPAPAPPGRTESGGWRPRSRELLMYAREVRRAKFFETAAQEEAR